jgi:hypothetical protein
MLGWIAANVGMGVAAGLAGTVAMTIAQTVEMKVTKREASPTPAKAVKKVFDIRPVDQKAESRLANLTHFAYGSSWGAVRGLLGAFGLQPGIATGVHLAAVQSTEYAMLPGLKLSPPVTKWGAKAVLTDNLFHVVYATATGLAFEWLRRDVRRAYAPLRPLFPNNPRHSSTQPTSST